MGDNFFLRLHNYYSDVGKALKGDANAAKIFPNSSDKGSSREALYKHFLQHHLPSKWNVFYGGFLFGEDGSESSQLDIIITADTVPRFDLFNVSGNGKSFAPVEGCLGVVSIKSKLDKKELVNALDGVASIPCTPHLGDKINPKAKLLNYGEWPYKIIYASDGLSAKTILRHIEDYYITNDVIPIARRPEMIHVAGKYVIFRIRPDMIIDVQGKQHSLPAGHYYVVERNPDVAAFLWIHDEMQTKALASNHILFRYRYLISEVSKFS